MELDTVAKIKQAWYRLLNTTSDDPALTEQGESADDVAYLFLTRGFRAAQRYMIDMGAEAWWRARSSAISIGDWSGSESSDGGRYIDLADHCTRFLRLWGDRTRRKSPLVQADGTTWGQLIEEEESDRRGDAFYLKGESLWLTRDASPKSPLYLEYYQSHPAFAAGLADEDINFPMDARWLGVAEAADAAKDEPWYLGDESDASRIYQTLMRARYEAKQIGRRDRRPRRMAPPPRIANHW